MAIFRPAIKAWSKGFHRCYVSRLNFGFVILSVFGLLVASNLALAQTIKGSCAPSDVKYVSGASGTSTTLDYANLANATILFVQGGQSPSCVIVDVSGEAFTDPGVKMLMRAVLDTSTIGLFSNFPFAFDTPPIFVSGRATFLFPSVPPGTHTLRIQIASGQTGKLVQLTQTHIIVRYMK